MINFQTKSAFAEKKIKCDMVCNLAKNTFGEEASI
jgi:hypothetical protein